VSKHGFVRRSHRYDRLGSPPRVEQPVFWETWQRPNVGIEKFYQAPTETELAHHLAGAVAWVEAHPDAAPAKAALIYAWNENDEGGWQFLFNAQPQILQLFRKRLPVDQINRRRTVPCGLFHSRRSECPSRQE
jgi:hypothetical protein